MKEPTQKYYNYYYRMGYVIIIYKMRYIVTVK